jgi:hypothetical protein
MRLLVQVPTENRNNTDNPPGEEIINQLPANETGLIATNDTEAQSTRSESDSIKSDLDIQEELESDPEELEEAEEGYQSESTAWSDKEENWWPTDPHHYYFEIDIDDFGIFIGGYGNSFRFVNKYNPEEGTNTVGYTLTVFKEYKDKYLTKNRHAWFIRYRLSDEIYLSLTLDEKVVLKDKYFFKESQRYYPEGKLFFEPNKEGIHHYCYINAEYALNLSVLEKRSLIDNYFKRVSGQYNSPYGPAPPLSYRPWSKEGDSDEDSD